MGLCLEFTEMDKLDLYHIKTNCVELEASACDWKKNLIFLSLMMNEMEDSAEGEEKTLTGHYTAQQLLTLMEMIEQALKRLKGVDVLEPF